MRGVASVVAGTAPSTFLGTQFAAVADEKQCPKCGSGKFTEQAMVGEPRAAMFEGIAGHVCIFPVDPATLLVVFGERDTNTGLFTVAAKQALAQVLMALNRHTTP